MSNQREPWWHTAISAVLSIISFLAFGAAVVLTLVAVNGS